MLPKGTLAFNPNEACSPLPRAYRWCDGSTYMAHTERTYRWRQIEIPKVLFEEPLVYQGGSDTFVGACDPIELTSEEWGLDFEAEIAVITGAVRMGTPASRAGAHIKPLMLCNDVSPRRSRDLNHRLSHDFRQDGEPERAALAVVLLPTTIPIEQCLPGRAAHSATTCPMMDSSKNSEFSIVWNAACARRVHREIKENLATPCLSKLN
ncbi:fumarylacetoacetate hydrolase family protein [Bradyrhizobium sp. LTSPM299]|uniref:fumarylacetoacetate hydrolase family protein n=1 Tax=Bradyrhizobium sp. LTSPM299 TaxID=1619233 RepID=UPI000AF58A9E|nr:fumarylacetoacetate hydrolase family protein [Bradyrhizobium sp. LTSPM299]